MKNLISEVARLKELESRATPDITGDNNIKISIARVRFGEALLIDAPMLLDVLREIRAGDADALEEIASILEGVGFVAKAAYVRRYCGMAKKMEENR
jgi:hypothetical protein